MGMWSIGGGCRNGVQMAIAKGRRGREELNCKASMEDKRQRHADDEGPNPTSMWLNYQTKSIRQKGQ